MKYSQILRELAVDMQPNPEPFNIGDLVVYKDSFVTTAVNNQLYVVVSAPRLREEPQRAYHSPSFGVPTPYMSNDNGVRFVEIARITEHRDHSYPRRSDHIQPDVHDVNDAFLRLATAEEITAIDERVEKQTRARFVESVNRLHSGSSLLAKFDGHGRDSMIHAVETHHASPILRKDPERSLGEAEVRLFNENANGMMGTLSVEGDDATLFESRVKILRDQFDEVAFRKHCRKLAKQTRKEYRRGNGPGIGEDIPAEVGFEDNGHTWVMYVLVRSKTTGERREHVLFDTNTGVVVDVDDTKDVTVVKQCIHGDFDVDYYVN